MKVLEKLETLVTEICNNDKIHVEENNIDEIKNRTFFSQRILSNAKEFMKVDFPEEDYQYDSISGLILDWSSTTNEPDEEYIWGGYNILGLFETLGYPSNFWDIYNNDSHFWENNPQPEAEAIWKEFLPKLNYFHKSGHGDDGTYGCILREEGVYPCPIYFFDSGIWFKMDMSLEEYYDTMIACKAVYYWQYFYTDTQEIVKKLGNYKPRYIEADAYYFRGPKFTLDKFEDGTFTYSAEGVLHQMKNIVKRFPKLFPDVDITYFKAKYDTLEKALNT
ncbi:hypothetical protein [Chryseobacterium sp. CCH4-E10]|jgi:hypothetical protein|uniref:hypothetical protein n=1 Tax=Chryseobacterium sp. CCH4-E10 TaxID=1768758 RepID=UPI00083476EA|nr:hypothetical protein [Chryseobacterium sp. CCH4-E10]